MSLVAGRRAKPPTRGAFFYSLSKEIHILKTGLIETSFIPGTLKALSTRRAIKFWEAFQCQATENMSFM
jgi:hypothetical protein